MSLIDLFRKPEAVEQPAAPVVTLPAPPASAWQAVAGVFVERSAHTLWESAGRDMLPYLRRRGLTDDTIRRATLGFNGRDILVEAAALGLVAKRDIRTGEPVPVVLPAGIVVPTTLGGSLVRVVVRRTASQQVACPFCLTLRPGPGRCFCGALQPRHRMLAGSTPADYLADYEVDEKRAALKPGTKLVADEIEKLLTAQNEGGAFGDLVFLAPKSDESAGKLS